MIFPTPDPFEHRAVIPQSDLKELDNNDYTRTNLYFKSHHLKLHAWVYMPKKVKNPPLILMAHGFGCQKDFVLDNYADRFAKAGYASLVFDYRGFGASEGDVWHEIDYHKHVEDYFSALDFVFAGGVEDVDLNRVFLWGTSYSGGHVITVAGTYPRKNKIAGVISQVPFVDGFSTALNVMKTSPILWSLQAPVGALKDLARSSLGLSRHYWPIYKSSSVALGILNTPNIDDEFENYLIVPNSWKVWKNSATAWAGLQFALYNPSKYVGDIEAPVFFLITSDDTLVPPQLARDASKKIKNCELKEIPSRHFDVYQGDLLEKAAKYEIEWLNSQIKKI